MKAIYIRVSTLDQNINIHQVEGVKQYVDKISGGVAFVNRPGASRLIKDINAGLVTSVEVSEISRLGRDTGDVLKTLAWFAENKVQLFSRREGLHLLDDAYNVSMMSKLTLTILSGFAEFERAKIKERQREGIQKAKERGQYKGRPEGSTVEKEVILNKHHKAVKLIKEGRGVREISNMKGMPSAPTVIKLKRLVES
jgi:DNA invertase Pin-like site-specific DNA recombinase